MLASILFSTILRVDALYEFCTPLGSASASTQIVLSPFIIWSASAFAFYHLHCHQNHQDWYLATWMVRGAAAGLLIGYDIREIALVPVPWGMTLALSLFGVASPSRNGFTWVGYGTRSH